MIKRILVAIDPSQYSKTAIQYACKIAKQHKAEVTGIIVLDIPGIEKHIGAVPLGGSYYAEQLESFKVREAQNKISALLDEFKTICRTNDVASHVSERQGIPSDRIIQESKFYDLLLIGLKTYFRFETSDKPGDSIEKIIDHSSTPILAVSEKLNIVNSKEKIKTLICFDGSLQSTRALHSFADIYNADIADITILTSHGDKETASFLLNQAQDYLKSYGFEDVKTIWKIESIKELMDGALYTNSYLIVLGAHSKSAVMEFIAGSLCKQLISKAEKPLLIGL